MADLFPNPPIKTIPGSPFITATSQSISSLGPWDFGGAKWGAGYVFAGTEPGSVMKSTDSGATWAKIDQSNAPSGMAASGVLDILFDPTAGKIHFLGHASGSPSPVVYAAFDLNTQLWGAEVTPGFTTVSSKMALRSNGDLVVVSYQTDSTAGRPLQYRIVTAGVFSSPTTLIAGTAATTWEILGLLVDGTDTVQGIVQGVNTTPALNALYHVSLTLGGSISGPTLIDGPPPIFPFNAVEAEVGVGGILGANLLWAWTKEHATTPHTYTVTVYKGTPLAAPVWTIFSGPTWSGNYLSGPSGASNRVHIVINNGVANLFWFKQKADDSERVMQYCTFDGTTFGTTLEAWNALTNPASGDPISGAAIDAFSVTTSGATFQALADEFIDPGYDQTLVYLSPPAAPPPLSIICDSPPSGTVGVAYTHTFPASGGTPPDTFSISVPALPPGLSINSTTGVVSGTPTTPGTFSFTVQVTDSAAGIASVPCSITIVAPPPIITCGSPPSGTVGSSYTHTFVASSGTPPYTYSKIAGNFPTGLGLNSGTGQLSGTPTAAGTFSFTIQVTDALGATDSVPCSIVIAAAPPPPPALVITCGNPPNGVAGVMYSAVLPISGGVEPYTLSIIMGFLPPDLTVLGSGLISGIPRIAGFYLFTVQVTDAVLVKAQVTCSITVTFPISPPCSDHHDDVHPYTANDQGRPGCPNNPAPVA